MKRMLAAIAAAFTLLPAVAQSPSYTPTPREVQQARDNAARDAKLANDMERARLREEAKPVSAYIPKEEKKHEPAARMHKPEVFTAAVPGSKPKKKSKKKGQG